MTTDLTAQVRALFGRAADDLETHGWFQDNYFAIPSEEDEVPQGCPSCALGALVRATGAGEFKDAFDNLVFRRAEATLAAMVGDAVGPWNDREDRTAEEVVGLFRKLASG